MTAGDDRSCRVCGFRWPEPPWGEAVWSDRPHPCDGLSTRERLAQVPPDVA